MTEIRIIPVSNLSNMMTRDTMLINDYEGTVETSYETILPSQTAFPMNTQGHLQFQIPTGSYQVVIKDSYLALDCVLTYHFKKVSVAWMINGAWWQQDYTLKTGAGLALDSLPVPTASTAALPQPYMVATAPLSSMAPFLESDISYNGVNLHTPRIFDKINYYLMRISPGAASKDQDTFFFSDDPFDPFTGQGDAAILFDGRPSKTDATGKKFHGATSFVNATAITQENLDPQFSLGPTASYTGDYAVSLYKRFKCPIQYLSDIFMQDSQPFYANAVNQSWINFQIKFQQYDMAKIFGSMYQGLTIQINQTVGVGLVQNVASLTTGTGHIISSIISGKTLATAINGARLELKAKSSSIFQADLQSQTVIPMKLQRALWSPLQQITNAGQWSQTINQSAENIQDIMFSVNINDTAYPDSTQIHGLSSFFCANDIVKIVNSGQQDFDSPYYYNFNMQIPYKGTTKNLVNGKAGIDSIEQFKCLTLSAEQLLNNPFEAPSPMTSNKLSKLFQNMFIINVEQFRGSSLTDDVIGDGLNTRGKGPIVYFQNIMNYSPNKKVSDVNSTDNVGTYKFGYAPTSVTTAGDPTYNQVGFAFNCYYFCEFWNIINPQSNKFTITEDIGQLRQSAPMQ